MRCRLHSRRLVLIVLLSALILDHANAVGQESVQDFPPKGDYKLTGTVVNSVTGEPVRRALVSVDGQAALTNAEGKFEIDDLPKSSTSVNVTKPGFFSETESHIGGNRYYSGQSVNIGPDSAPVTLKLVPEAIIYGKIESDREPVTNLTVKLMQQEVIEGRRQWFVSGTTMANDDGEFRIPNLASGTYYLSAGPNWKQSAGLTETSRKFEQGYAETFYPQASDLAGAAPIRISAGDDTEADFSLKTTRLFKISGSIAGIPAQGANLQFINSAEEVAQFPVHYNPPTGGFETMAPGGAYVLKAEEYIANRQAMMVASLPLNISSDMTGIRLTLSPAISIPVQVQKDAVQPVDTHRSSFSTNGLDRNGKSYQITINDGSSVQVGLRAENQSFRNQQYFATYRIAGDTPVMGIENVEPGRYIAVISAGPLWYVESAQCGGVDLLREELPIGIGMQPPPISLVLRNDPAQISGKVSSEGSPARGAVLIIPEGRPWGTRKIEANQQGSYLLQGLAPGDYDVLALDHAEDLEYTNPEVLRLYLPRAQHIVLQPNQKEELNLEIVKGGQE